MAKKKRDSGDHTGEFYASDNPERYNMGPSDTPEDAIEAFKAEYDSEPSCVGRATARYVHIDGERLLDDLCETMGDDLYEDAMDGWCHKLPSDAYLELGHNLTRVLHNWLRKHKQDRCWNVIEEINMPDGTPPQPVLGEKK